MSKIVEEWKSVVGYEGLYEVSDWGNVKSLNYRKRGYEKILIPQSSTKYGHLHTYLSGKTEKPKKYYIHRLVAQAFIPNPDNLQDVNHVDGNKQNNCVDNLEWCTRSYNIKHAYDIGLRKASNQKLTAEQVEYIRRNPCNLTRYELAQMFDVTYWCICDIYQGKSHKKGVI